MTIAMAIVGSSVVVGKIMAIIETRLNLTEQDRKFMDGIIASGEFVQNLIRRDKEPRTETTEKSPQSLLS